MTSTGATRQSGRRRGRRGARVLVLLVVAVLLVAAAWYWIPKLYDTAKSHFSSDTCSIGSYDLDPPQASVAATMVGATTKFRVTLPARASVLVLMAGLQESKLQNLAPGEGDRDSVGVLQQRPSQGWGGGKASALTDVGEATREFLEALVKIPKWQTLPPAEAIQKVQISADGSAYAQHEPEAHRARERPARVRAGRRELQLRQAVQGRDRDRGRGAGAQGARHHHPGGCGAHDPGARCPVADGGLVRRQRRPPRHRAGRLRREDVDARQRLEALVRAGSAVVATMATVAKS